MRGSTAGQVQNVFMNSGILAIGESKHEAKREARDQGKTTWSQIGRELKIHSYGTAETYKNIWHDFANYGRSEMGLKDLEKTSGEHALQYLEHKVEQGVSANYFSTVQAALGKFEKALNMYSEKYERGQNYDFRDGIKEAREVASRELQKTEQSRGYEDPRELINRIETDAHKIASQIQLEGGARISEAGFIKSEQLAGKGKIHLDNTKGGLERDIKVSLETYQKLGKYISENGKFEINHDAYRGDICDAAKASGQNYNGSHGLRWNFAQERMEKLQENGRGYTEALKEVSEEMGHHRVDITEHYLR